MRVRQSANLVTSRCDFNGKFMNNLYHSNGTNIMLVIYDTRVLSPLLGTVVSVYAMLVDLLSKVGL